MAKCGKCDGMFFRVEEISPSGAQYKMFTVQCSSVKRRSASPIITTSVPF
jgi:hypothetical protein